MSPDNPADSTRVGLCLDPLDVLFFRDGRPFDAGARAYGGLPLPRTVAGALRTALLASKGFDFAGLRARSRGGSDHGRATTRALLAELHAPDWILDARFRGPWLALMTEESNGQSSLSPLLPVPATLARRDGEKGAEGKWFRSGTRGKNPPGWTDADLPRPLWPPDDRQAKYPGGYLTLDGIRRFLENENG
ncbi:MAG: type III-B CRISPR module-associated Cmr3 family protein, partial [Isosphaeraceae bacterium]